MPTKRQISPPLALLAFALSIVLDAAAADTSGIKAANLKGADVELMSNHDPASELENFDLLPGYQANLFATDPMLANPIHMHWDSRGRLWVACSWSYPQIKPGAVADDKIVILEDTDNDGDADKSTVFADGLYLPTGIELANGGCYVGQSPDIFFLKDTDGDDVADEKQLALTGFGIEDSHHSISAWRRGPGGWIYFQEGIFLHAQVETQYGVVRNFNGGVFQFNPRTQELRVFCSGTGGNPWGHVFDRWGQSFMVNNPRIMYLSPATGNSGESVPVKSLISTEKQCGGDLATGSHVGDDIRGQLLTGRFKSRAVVRYEFIEDEAGAGFSANVLEPLISSKHPNFRPVDVKTGPDGAIYVADWYNSIINHAQHDFRDPRRDHQHGRIWRITHKQRPLVKKPELVGVSLEALAEHLKSPQDWTRHQARKELSERDPDKVQKVLEQWTQNLDPELPDYDHHLVEAMWACQNVERASEAILTRVLNAKDGHARSAGARVLRYWHQDLSDPVGMIAKAAGDEFPRTRMEAVLSAGYIPKAEAYAAALHSIDHPGDPVLDQALPQTAKALEEYWRPAMEAGTLTFAKDSHQAFVEARAGIGFDKRLAIFLRNPAPKSSEIKELASQLVAVGTGKDIRLVISALGDQGLSSAEASIAMLGAVKRMAGPHSSRANNRAIGSLRRLLDNQNDEVAALAAENMGQWNAPKAGPALLSLIEEDRSPRVRRAAAVAAALMGKTEHIESLAALSRGPDIETRYAAVSGLVQGDVAQGVKAAAKLLTEDPGAADPVPLIQLILKDRKGSRSLADALSNVDPHPKVISRVAEFHRTSGQLPKNLAGLFQPEPTGSSSLTEMLLAEDLDALTADVVKLGDAHRGEMIYRRRALACSNCHAIGSAGPEIGPNLVAVGAAATPEYMVESILKPNAAIAEHFENRLFTLKDGTIQLGVITFKSEQEVVVRDSAQAGREVRMAAADILKEQAMPSLMPAGLADQLRSRQEFLDLARFLSVLGRPGDFANDESPVIRKWRITAAPGNDAQPSDDDDAWLPAYSKVDGELPTSELALTGTESPVLARGFIDVQVAGGIELQINETKALKLSVDGKNIDDLTAPLALTKGRHSLTFSIDTKQRNDTGLRVELKAADDSVKFQPEGGL